MRVPVGPVADVPDDRCVAVGDGQVVVVRVGGELRAFENRCLHQDSLLAGGIVRNGVLSCPLHFWRYRVADGSLIGSKRSLPRFPIDIVEGVAFVLVPDVPSRDRFASNCSTGRATYDRDAAWEADHDAHGV